MGPEYVYVFDYKNSFDRLKVPDIPRPVVRYDLEGEVKMEEDPRQYDLIDLIIVAARLQDPPLSYQAIADRVDRSKTTIAQRVAKLRKLPYLREALK